MGYPLCPALPIPEPDILRTIVGYKSYLIRCYTTNIRGQVMPRQNGYLVGIPLYFQGIHCFMELTSLIDNGYIKQFLRLSIQLLFEISVNADFREYMG